MRCKDIFGRKRRVMKSLVARVLVVAMTVSSIWLAGNVQTVYAAETEETKRELTTEAEVRNINLNLNGKIAGINNPTIPEDESAKWSNGTGSKIYFGNIGRCQVLDTDTTDYSNNGTHTVFVISEYQIGCSYYDKPMIANNGQKKANDWKYSDSYLYLTGETGVEEPYTFYSDNIKDTYFTPLELSMLIENYNISHGDWDELSGNLEYTELTGEKLFTLDAREVEHKEYGFMNTCTGSVSQSFRNGSQYLRSPVMDDNNKVAVTWIDGEIINYNADMVSGVIYPAFNIRQSSIFYSSYHEDVDWVLSANPSLDTSYKETAGKGAGNSWNLSFFDGNDEFVAVRTDKGSVKPGDSVKVNITDLGEHTDGVEYDQISAMLTDENGTVVAYGGIKNIANGMGMAEVKIPENLDNGNYTVRVFAEDIQYQYYENSVIKDEEMGGIRTLAGSYASYPAIFEIEVDGRTDTEISFDNYNPSTVYSDDMLSNPAESQLTITGADYQDVNFTWYKDSVSEDNKLESAPSNAGVYYLVASIADTPTLKASSVTSEPIEISPKTVTPYISGSISKIYDGTSSTENAISSLNVELNGVLSSDSVSVDGFSFSYIDSEIGTGKTITATNITLSGADKDNYVLSSSTATAEVGTIGKREKPLNIPEQEISVANTVKFVADSMNLPEGWEWNDGDGEKTIAAGKTVTATAIYTAEDGCYYETTSEEISITRADCEENLDIIVDLEPTCTEKGIGHTICSLCGDTLRESVEISELGHDWNDEYTIDREADCTNKGSKSLHCSRCEGKKDIIEITALGHLWGNGTVTKVASCMENGIMMYSCENCSETKTESISKLAHAPAKTVMENQIQPDCINGGSYDEVQYCSVCQAELSRNYIAVAAVGHSLIKVEAKEPTVSETGNTEYWKCEGCSQLFSDENGTNITTIEAVTIPVKETGTSNSGNTNNGSNNDSDINNGNTDGESGGGNYTGNTEESGDVAINPPVNADSQGKPEDSGLNANNSSQVEHPENGTNGDSSMNTDSSDHTDNVNNKDSVDGQKEENTVKDDTTGTGTKTEQSKVTVPSVGTVLKDTKTNSKYVVTSKKSKTVRYSGTIKKNTSTVSIPATVKIDGVTYKVTSIQTNAFRNNKKIKKIIIGSNIKKIGKNAFYGCKNLKSITIRSTQLTEKMVGGNAFKGIDRKAVIKVPKEKHKIYQKLLKSRGFKGKIKAVSLK